MTRIRVVDLAVGLAALPLIGCAETPSVRAVSDQAVNFGQYHTFGFVSPLATDRRGYQSLLSQSLKSSTQRQLEARGLRYDPVSPQLIVDFSATVSEKLRVDTTPVANMGPGPGFGYGWRGGYYGYRVGLYSPWPTYQDQTTVTPYKEGTLNIDVADAGRKQLVWEGVVTGSVTDKVINRLDAAVDAAVTRAFAKFPMSAGGKASAP